MRFRGDFLRSESVKSWAAGLAMVFGLSFSSIGAAQSEVQGPPSGDSSAARGEGEAEITEPLPDAVEGTPSLDAGSPEETTALPPEVRIQKPPLDFCKLAPQEGVDHYQKQRVLLLDVEDSPSMKEAPEFELVQRGDKTVREPRSLVQRLDVFHHAREAFVTSLPLRRHYWVFAQGASHELFKTNARLSLDQVQTALGEDRFAVYSAACADWIVRPTMTRGDAAWKRTVHEETINGRKSTYSVWELDLTMNGGLQLFHREGDEFVQIAQLQGTSRGVSMSPTTYAQSTRWNNPETLAEVVSMRLPEDCGLPGSDEGQAFESCEGIVPAFEVPGVNVPGAGQGNGHYCQNLNARTDAQPAETERFALCRLRRAAEEAALDLQNEVKKLCGWKLFAGLVDVPGKRLKGIRLGHDEGVFQGQYYIAKERGSVCGTGKEIGWGRVQRVGVGGEKGVEDPSLVKFRVGNPAAGSYMEEHTLIGARIGVEPVAQFLLSKGALESSVAIGAAVRVGYDLSPIVGAFDEFWLVGGAAYLLGGSSENFLNFDLGLEGMSYLGGHLGFFYGAGFAYLTAKKGSLGGGLFGGGGRLGLDYAFSPEWSLRLMGEGKTGFGTVALRDSSGIPGFDAGSLASVSGSLAVTVTF